RIRGDELFDCFGIRGADGRNEGCQLRVHRLGGRLLLDFDPEVRALVYPGAQEPDLIIRERTGRRHLESAIAIDQPADELTAGAVAGNDYRPVVAAAEGGLAAVEPEPCLLHFRAMA